MGWLALVTQGLRAWAETVGLISKRSDLNNAPDVKQGKVNVQEQKEVDRINANVEKGDIDEMRKDAAE